MRVPEVTALVEAVMAGRVHQDYVQAHSHTARLPHCRTVPPTHHCPPCPPTLPTHTRRTATLHTSRCTARAGHTHTARTAALLPATSTSYLPISLPISPHILRQAGHQYLISPHISPHPSPYLASGCRPPVPHHHGRRDSPRFAETRRDSPRFAEPTAVNMSSSSCGRSMHQSAHDSGSAQ